MYNKLENAISFCFSAHEGQKRKHGNISFAIHPITVGMMLKDIGCDEDMVISGILHDVIEDTNYTYENIKSEFGRKN